MPKKVKTPDWNALRAYVKGLSPQTLLAIADVSGGDGHSLYDPAAYVRAGASPEFVAAFTKTYQSDGSPKGTIFSSQGTVIPESTGIYGLEVVEWIATALELPVGSFMGRGWRARAAHGAIVSFLQLPEPASVPAASL